MFCNYSELFEMQKLPMEEKLAITVGEMGKAIKLSRHKIAIAFSGGKDSQVVAHIFKTNYPDVEVHGIFGNTGVEYPESLRFARDYGKRLFGEQFFHEAKPGVLEEDGLKYEAQKETLEWLIREGRASEVLQADGKLKTTKALETAATQEMWEDFRNRNLVWRKGTPISYWWCVDQYGFPILGKAASKLDARRINIDCFLRFSNSKSEKSELIEYYNMLREVKISQHCCKLLKKEPSERLQSEIDVDVIIKGLMAAESRSRQTNFCTRGYIFESKRQHLGDDPFYHVNPISIWTDEDIWEYIHKYIGEYSPLYDMGWEDQHGEFHNIKRNGCMGCATGIMFADNQMAMLRRTHPQAWRAIMKSGMAKELQALRLYKSNGLISFFDYMSSADELIDLHPCVFDSVSELVMSDSLTTSEYDAEDL